MCWGEVCELVSKLSVKFVNVAVLFVSQDLRVLFPELLKEHAEIRQFFIWSLALKRFEPLEHLCCGILSQNVCSGRILDCADHGALYAVMRSEHEPLPVRRLLSNVRPNKGKEVR